MMPTVSPTSMWSTDLTRLCERLAERLRTEGARHPTSAAVALAVRGARGRTQEEYAADLGLAPAALDAVERGQVRWAEVPAALMRAAVRTEGLDLARLRRPGE